MGEEVRVQYGNCTCDWHGCTYHGDYFVRDRSHLGIDWLSSYVGAITASGNEVLLLAVVAIPVAGFGVGILRRLINIRA